MKIVLIGDDRWVGPTLLRRLDEQGHDVARARVGAPDLLEGASVVVDVSDTPSLELLAAELAAGVSHHVTLSVVGLDRLSEGDAFRNQLAREQLLQSAAIPYSIVRATPLFESLLHVADVATVDETVRLPPVFVQPIAAGDVADALGRIAVGPPLNDVIEIAGPGPFRLDELVRRFLTERNDPREVITDTRARYLGAAPTQRTLLPGQHHLVGHTRIQDAFGQLMPV